MLYAILEIENRQSLDEEEDEVCEQQYIYIPIESREKIIQLLIDGRADVNAQTQVLCKYR